MLHKYETLTKLVYYSGPIKIMAAKGKQNVGAIMSGERGTNVIVATAVSAQEIQCPQCLCFLAKITKIILLTMVHLTCIGVGYGSGWVTDIEFKKYMQL